MRSARTLVVGAALAIAALAPLAGSPALAVRADHACTGHWSGTGEDPWNPGHPYRIEVTITNRGLVPVSAPPTVHRSLPCGTIEYGLGCGGSLGVCRVNGARLTATENYSHGEDRCAPAGRVVMTCEGSSMQFAWSGTAGQMNTRLERATERGR